MLLRVPADRDHEDQHIVITSIAIVITASGGSRRVLSTSSSRSPSPSIQPKSLGRWRCYDYDELVARDKCSLDLFWLKDDSLLDAANLPDPDVIAAEIAEDLRAAVEQIEEILGDLQEASP